MIRSKIKNLLQNQLTIGLEHYQDYSYDDLWLTLNVLRQNRICCLCFYMGNYKNIQCKKSVDFTAKYLATSCQSISRCFYGRLLVEHFYKSIYGRVMLIDNTRKYLCRVKGLYDQKQYMIPENIYGRLQKITGNGLAAGCQLFYRKIYG